MDSQQTWSWLGSSQALLAAVLPLLAAMAAGGCSSAPRRLTHEETLAWAEQNKAWVVARKTRPICVRELDADEVGKEFETADHTAETARAGFWLCVGVAGEPWFQSPERVTAKYEPAGEEERKFAFDAKPRKYRIYKPRGEARVWAACVRGPGIEGFYIHPGYDPSTSLYAPAGGYVVRDYVADPNSPAQDVWLVQQALFESTYEVIKPER